jgi:hypothetical protein
MGKEPNTRADERHTEMRNRIYYYAEEDEHEYEGYIPLLTNRSTGEEPRPLINLAYSSRKFFGLTQVCKKIRAEYLPLWIRSASLRVSYDEFDDYVDTFHNEENDPVVAPKLLQISYDLGKEYEAPVKPHLNLLPFLEFRAHHPTTQIELIPIDNSGWKNPERGPEFRLYGFCLNCGEADSGKTEALCDQLKADLESLQWDAWYGYVHLYEANTLISHENRIWTADIASGFISGVRLQEIDATNVVRLRINTKYPSSWEYSPVFDQNRKNKVVLRTDPHWQQYRKEVGLTDMNFCIDVRPFYE